MYPTASATLSPQNSTFNKNNNNNNNSNSNSSNNISIGKNAKDTDNSNYGKPPQHEQPPVMTTPAPLHPGGVVGNGGIDRECLAVPPAEPLSSHERAQLSTATAGMATRERELLCEMAANVPSANRGQVLARMLELQREMSMSEEERRRRTTTQAVAFMAACWTLMQARQRRARRRRAFRRGLRQRAEAAASYLGRVARGRAVRTWVMRLLDGEGGAATMDSGVFGVGQKVEGEAEGEKRLQHQQTLRRDQVLTDPDEIGFDIDRDVTVDKDTLVVRKTGQFLRAQLTRLGVQCGNAFDESDDESEGESDEYDDNNNEEEEEEEQEGEEEEEEEGGEEEEDDDDDEEEEDGDFTDNEDGECEREEKDGGCGGERAGETNMTDDEEVGKVRVKCSESGIGKMGPSLGSQDATPRTAVQGTRKRPHNLIS